MNPYMIIGAIAISTIFYSGMVALFAWLGTAVISAMFLVYGAMLLLMMTMQRRASVSCSTQVERTRFGSFQSGTNQPAMNLSDLNLKIGVEPVPLAASKGSSYLNEGEGTASEVTVFGVSVSSARHQR